jgi:7-carboxy-7-deazaguanine synthase
MKNTYRVHERFATFQGEGVHAGQPAFFIRLFGCPVKCPWCDSAGTWHPNWVPKDVEIMTTERLVGEATAVLSHRAVITGGEPTIYDLTDLTIGLQDESILVHLETSGAFPLKGTVDWITLSPKKWKPPIQEMVADTDEFKFIIESPEDILFYYEMIKDLGFKSAGIVPIWLHPEWSQRDNKEVLNAIAKAVTFGEDIFRAGWQLHKLYQVDALDHRTRPLVPLGGDEKKGY